MYDPTLGRFLQEDPIGIAAGDPNFYRYCGNNPIRFTDPDGQKIVVEEGQEEYFVGLLNQLCPNGHFDVNPFTGSVEPADPQFCSRKDAFYEEEDCEPATPVTPESCKCVCDAISSLRVFDLRRLRGYEGPGRKGEIIPGGETHFEDSDHPQIFVGSELPNGVLGPGGTRVPAPEWLILGHELCGHAVPKYGNSKSDETVDIENRIRREHDCGECGPLGQRDRRATGSDSCH